MNSKVVLGIIAVMVIGVGAYLYSNNQNEMKTEQKAQEEKMMMEQKAMEEKEMMEKDAMKDDKMMEGDKMMEKDQAMMSKGAYEAYAPEKLAMAESGKVVLFFRASWCPTCRALDADIKESMADIPAGVTILDVDYDKETELKKKYGVTMQHTLVQVDKNGNQIAKWTGSSSLEELVKNIK